VTKNLKILAKFLASKPCLTGRRRGRLRRAGGRGCCGALKNGVLLRLEARSRVAIARDGGGEKAGAGRLPGASFCRRWGVRLNKSFFFFSSLSGSAINNNGLEASIQSISVFFYKISRWFAKTTHSNLSPLTNQLSLNFKIISNSNAGGHITLLIL
jgi:hypothetical protein